MAITKVQQASLLTGTFSNSAWSSATTALTSVTAGNLVLALGGWWDAVVNTGGSQNIPTNSNGTFVKAGAAAPTIPSSGVSPGWPVAPELCEILSANAGTHTITPQSIFPGGGDGYFLAAEFTGGTGTWTRVDDGYGFAGSGTAGAVNTVTVTTGGTNALIGDLVVSIGTTDGDPTAFGLSSPSNGSWNNILTTSTSGDNIGMGVAWRIATANGAQSAQWDTPDNDCELANAVIAVYRFATSGGGTALTGQGATLSSGNLAANRTIALTGQAITVSLGTVKGDHSSSLTGQPGTFSSGTITASNRTIVLVGQPGTLSLGTLSPVHTSSLTGQGVTFSVGTLTPSTQKALSGQAGTFSTGTLALSFTRALLGEQSTFSTGAVVTGNDVTIGLIGQTAGFNIGAIGLSFQVPVVGSSSTTSSGTLATIFSVSTTGTSLTSSTGSLTPSLALGVTGTVIPSGLGLIASGTNVGTLGTALVFSTGSLTPSLTIPLIGISRLLVAGAIVASGGDVVVTQVASMLMLGRGVRKNR